MFARSGRRAVRCARQFSLRRAVIARGGVASRVVPVQEWLGFGRLVHSSGTPCCDTPDPEVDSLKQRLGKRKGAKGGPAKTEDDTDRKGICRDTRRVASERQSTRK